MAIITSFSVCQTNGCSSLIFNDLTGAYSLDNLNGYNSPNEDITNATAVLNITSPTGTITSITLTGFPTTNKSLEFTITGEDIGYSSGIIPDGLYTFQYVVTTALGTIITQTRTQGLLCNVNCCVKSMFLDVNTECQDCIKAIDNNSIKAYLMLKGLEYSLYCNNTTNFNNTLTQLNKLCNNTNCLTCR